MLLGRDALCNFCHILLFTIHFQNTKNGGQKKIVEYEHLSIVAVHCVNSNFLLHGNILTGISLGVNQHLFTRRIYVYAVRSRLINLEMQHDGRSARIG